MSSEHFNILLTIVLAAFSSTGLWAVVLRALDSHSAQAQMVKGLGHDRILYLGQKYVDRGYITHDEYENLNDYLYNPYKKLNGNGSAERMMEEVRKLPFRASHNDLKGKLIND